MDFHYELLSFEVWHLPGRPGLILGVAGVVDRSEIAAFTLGRDAKAGFASLTPDEPGPWVSLQLRARGPKEDIRLIFAARLVTRLRWALRKVESGELQGLLLVFTDEQSLAANMKRLRLHRDVDALDAVRAAALYADGFTVEPDTLVES